MPETAPSSSHAAASFDRERALESLANRQFDVLVIGGGITGAGVALDAASRGLVTALVETDDFASGTSSKSSKLVHGGLRYLQQHEFRLVYENLAERQRLLENAPHLVSPLPFLIPLFGRDGVVSSGVAKVYRTALWLYDLTGGVRIGKRHENVTRDQVLAHMPTLQADRLAAGFLYWDARTDDARLTLAVARTAVVRYGAVAANHTAVTSLHKGQDGTIEGVRAQPEGGESFDIRATVVVNAAGVWADQVRTLDEGSDPRSIRPAKGIHVTVPNAVFPCDIAAVIPVRQDHRSIFVVSWGNQVYLGTTDTDWDGPLEDPSAGPEDVEYILEAANAVTTHPIAKEDITGIWTGLRPLLAPAEGRHPLSERTADLSRRHTVQRSKSGFITVTGGKLTTYRKMAQDTVDLVEATLGHRRAPCVTKDLRLLGAGPRSVRHRRKGLGRRRPLADPDAVVQPTNGAGVDAADAQAKGAAVHLAARYGTETPAVLAMADGRDGLLDPLVPGLPYLAVEAVYAVRAEMARSLSDVLDRRTRASLRDARATARAARSVAALVGPELGWDEARAEAEADAYAVAVSGRLVAAGLEGSGDVGWGAPSVACPIRGPGPSQGAASSTGTHT